MKPWLALVLLFSGCTIQSRLGPPVGHRREVCDDAPDGGRYIGMLRAGDAFFFCRSEGR
jgi:hypothetical protein